LKLIVTDMDGTLLNSNRTISRENAAALLAAQAQGIEIAIATGRTYGNALALCQRVGLSPHIISNHGAFVYTNKGERLLGIGIKEEHVKEALNWLSSNNYFYNLCTDRHSFIPANVADIFINDYKTAKNRFPQATEAQVQEAIRIYQSMDGRMVLNQIDDVFEQNLTFGSITSITFDQDKLRIGREYFTASPHLSMTVAGKNIFEMIHPSVSKGNALEYLIEHLRISMEEVMAIGDNYNDISMLERVGISVAIGNAEETVKKICKHVSLSNDLNGVAYIVNQMMNNS
jgi:Cof subfamily protein (haloacid dehalogenase superfamily)